MKKSIVVLCIVSLISCYSESQEDAESIEETEDIEINNSGTADNNATFIKDEDFITFLKKFHYSISLPINTENLMYQVNDIVPPSLKQHYTPKTDTSVKPLVLFELEKYLGLEEKKEVKLRESTNDKLEYFPLYRINRTNKKIISCLFVRRTLSMESDYGGILLVNYDLSGNVISKQMVYKDGDGIVAGVREQESITLTSTIENDKIQSQKRMFYGDSTFIGEVKISFEKDGRLKLIHDSILIRKIYESEDSNFGYRLQDW